MRVALFLFMSISAWGQSVDEALVKNLDFFMKLDLVRTQEMLMMTQDKSIKDTSKDQTVKQDLKEGQSEKN